MSIYWFSFIGSTEVWYGVPVFSAQGITRLKSRHCLVEFSSASSEEILLPSSFFLFLEVAGLRSSFLASYQQTAALSS